MDTIVSPASAPVAQAVGIVRVSGGKAFEVASKLLRTSLPEPGTFAFRDIYSLDGKLIDSGLVLVFKSPASFTGEDVVEFQLHGSPAVLEKTTSEIEKLGVRRANAGEFSFRAWVNGKASLPELELANALSNLRPTEGNKSISLLLDGWRAKLTGILAEIEAGISFPTDSQTDIASIHKRLDQVKTEISKIAREGKPGIPKIALAGRQNAGKSTLFNRLLGYERTVVSEVPGTTRDHLSIEINLEGNPVQLFDGPGFEVESDDRGQRLYSGFVATADLAVWVDPDALPPEHDFEKIILVKSKSDISNVDSPEWINVCAKTGKGLDDLVKAIVDALPSREHAVTSRQHELIAKLEKSVLDSLSTETDELIASELQVAVGLLSELDGVGLQGDVLNSIFSTFCIGK